MVRRELKASPQIVPLYLRAAATLVPGAGRLPGIPGGGGPMPELEIGLRDVPIEAERVDGYRRICGWAADGVPATFLHVLAFPLHMALMSDASFPFAAIGLVHVENEITQLRPMAAGERVSFAVKAGPIEAHPRGRTFSILTSAYSNGEPVWRERSTMLRRGATTAPGQERSGAAGAGAGEPRGWSNPAQGALAESWELPEDIGRRYGAVSGDRNPIHLHRLSAKAFGFPRAIAHGMWTKARCVGALGPQLPDSFTVGTRFRKPVLLPATVQFESREGPDGLSFSLQAAGGGSLHLVGEVRALDRARPAQMAPVPADGATNGVQR
ncbi:MAG: MaoC/PaaZ C-terminal domain-containing protein [Solirubrobacteraceae bacterium]